MKKKLLVVALGLLIPLVFLMACSNKKQEVRYYDDDFIESLAKGLDNRWKFTESDQWEEDSASYKKAIDSELDQVSEYRNKKFKSNQLQELAISYINELENAKKIVKGYSTDSFDDKYDEHYSKRTKLLNEINKMKKIPVDDKETLEELLEVGKEAASNDKKKEAIENLVSTIQFEVNDEESDEYSTTYTAIVENTTDYTIKDLSLEINLIDADDVTVTTEYVNANNWKEGAKTKMEFTVFDEEFEKTDTTISYYEVE